MRRDFGASKVRVSSLLNHSRMRPLSSRLVSLKSSIMQQRYGVILLHQKLNF